MTPVRKHNSSNPIAVRRLPVTFTSDVRRVITRFFDIVFRTGVIHSDHEVEMDPPSCFPLDLTLSWAQTGGRGRHQSGERA